MCHMLCTFVCCVRIFFPRLVRGSPTHEALGEAVTRLRCEPGNRGILPLWTGDADSFRCLPQTCSNVIQGWVMTTLYVVDRQPALWVQRYTPQREAEICRSLVNLGRCYETGNV
ncbi:hypothetical protein M011DRAFT_43523 [Sporormia fimetaria CBS 119925]|uniref:Secreted protein n=1 Tax=Sporormia fimetaria CBS 119925 TaxID=1340428 RepID=A0A6A6VBC7_9PLEO|nr:hypothetical protein M011DRAFT_43523 [Sporormia fimetaria CBS 119925]